MNNTGHSLITDIGKYEAAIISVFIIMTTLALITGSLVKHYMEPSWEASLAILSQEYSTTVKEKNNIYQHKENVYQHKRRMKL